MEQKVIVRLCFQLIAALNEAHACGIIYYGFTDKTYLLLDNFDLVLSSFDILKGNELLINNETNI